MITHLAGICTVHAIDIRPDDDVGGLHQGPHDGCRVVGAVPPQRCHLPLRILGDETCRHNHLHSSNAENPSVLM